MREKFQILFIHGGSTFKNKNDYFNFLKNRKISIKENVKWSDKYLDDSLGKQFEIIRPKMPLRENAKYDDWKIHFERYFPFTKNNIILIGNSLGGIFLAKYLSENKFPKKILSVYLICPPYDNSLGIEDLVGGFRLKSNLSLLQKNTKNLYFLFSHDDDVVPIAHAEKYKNNLPNAKFIIFKNKNGHFKISKFPEIIRMIKNDIKKSLHAL